MEKRFTDVWCCETGHIGLTDHGIDKTFTGDEFEEFLNSLNEVPGPFVLSTRICQEDFDKIERMLVRQFDSHSDMNSINRIHALQRENELLKQGNPFNKVLVEHAINKKIDDVLTMSNYGDVPEVMRTFAKQVLIELEMELEI